MNKKILWLIMIVLMCSFAFATSNWEEFGKYNNRAGFQDPSFTGYFNNESNTDSSVLASGLDFQPLVNDFDSDGDVEILTGQGNFLQLYQYIEGTVSLFDEVNLGGPITVMPWSGNIDSDSYIEIVVYNGINISTYEYNGSNFILNSTSSANVVSGIACRNISGTFGCYSMNGSGYLNEYNPNTGGFFAYNITGPNDYFDTDNSEKFSPPFEDFDNDGKLELVVSCNADGDALEGICVIDRSATSLDTGFSTDGIIDDIGGSFDSEVISILTYNLNGAGTQEVCVSTQESTITAGSSGDINCYRSDGSSYGSSTRALCPSGVCYTTASGLTMADIDGTGQLEICYSSRQNSAWASTGFTLDCFETGASTLTLEASFTSTDFDGYSQISPIISSADMNNDGLDDILLGDGIFMTNATGTGFTFYNITGFQTAGGLNQIPVDMDQDGVLESCGTESGQIGCAYTSYTDNIPTLTDSFGRSYDNPVCNGTTLRFSAKEYDETETQIAGTNYYNDIDTQTERLAVDCYGNGTLTYGDYSLATPYVDCTYNNPTDYYATVYVQDDGNTADLTQFEDVVIQVVVGSAGNTCNKDSLGIGEDSLADVDADIPISTPTSNGIGAFLDYFTGGEEDYQIFIGMALLIVIVLSVGIGMATVTQNGMAVVVSVILAGVTSFICLTAIGLFPIWLLVLIMLFLGMATVLAVMFKGGA